jgi:hypothetical protein
MPVMAEKVPYDVLSVGFGTRELYKRQSKLKEAS